VTELASGYFFWVQTPGWLGAVTADVTIHKVPDGSASTALTNYNSATALFDFGKWHKQKLIYKSTDKSCLSV